MPIALNNTKLYGIYDTGANVCLIDKELAWNAGAIIKERPMSLQGVVATG
jgi:hypothetical protein